jgi:hypothetical protein
VDDQGDWIGLFRSLGFNMRIVFGSGFMRDVIGFRSTRKIEDEVAGAGSTQFVNSLCGDRVTYGPRAFKLRELKNIDSDVDVFFSRPSNGKTNPALQLSSEGLN